MELKDKALLAIEGLTFQDVIMSDKEKLSRIYKFAHIALRTCQNDHKIWHKELDNCLNFLDKGGIIRKSKIG